MKENNIDYGLYYNCSLVEFFNIICRDPRINEHHVFPSKLRNGENRKNLEEFGAKAKETKDVLAPAHAMNNKLFKNASPPVVLERLLSIIENEHFDISTKQFFIKFCQCALKEKLEIVGQENKFSKIGQIMKNIDIDINNGNNITIKDIIIVLDLTMDNIAYYLEKNFFPSNWRYFNPKLWDLYL